MAASYDCSKARMQRWMVSGLRSMCGSSEIGPMQPDARSGDMRAAGVKGGIDLHLTD